MNKELSKAIINLVVMAVLAVNAALTAKGINPIPFDESAVTEWLTYIASGAAAVWSWWKNNNITSAACEAQGTLEQIKGRMQNNITVEAIGGEDDEQDV